MRLFYLYTKLRYDGHRSLVLIEHAPNFFERLFLGKKKQVIKYVGIGTKWKIQNKDLSFSEITDKKMIPLLEQIGGRTAFKQRHVLQHHGKTIKKGIV
jgi:hypothetical protein